MQITPEGSGMAERVLRKNGKTELNEYQNKYKWGCAAVEK